MKDAYVWLSLGCVRYGSKIYTDRQWPPNVRRFVAFSRTCSRMVLVGGSFVARSGCRFSSKTSCIFTLILQSAKVPKYHQSIKIRRRALKYQNIGCIDADFCADFAIFLHFSRSTRIYCRKRVKMSKNAKILRTKFGNFQKMSKKRSYFDTLAVFCTLVLCLIFALSFWNLRKSAPRASRAVRHALWNEDRMKKLDQVFLFFFPPPPFSGDRRPNGIPAEVEKMCTWFL